ncbi:YHS domain-containing protein [Empedobacter stercoris]|uniref:YHS domain-containing protein n=1 Tax=Empedobacter stercoris TaxID=1628248 RepID=UPI001CE1BBEF|nr:YHS domain-containing protein [Empedobacter stercoris]MCA4781557.1 YHS domain-containing protein [Empedobacter stercoris]
MKNSKNIFALTILAIAFTSCNKEQAKQEEFEVQHVSHEEMKAVKKLDVAVVNEIDPICGMKTADHLSDTANYEGKTYGFCSTMCKEEFLKNPESHIHE